ncbi:MAG TPA: mechanosensitive ion channel family protein [Pseudomonadota bacterium]|nr:mechanosensitive ion channel family protein [Pseudomonadota bacterium]HNN49949.1 mechanosensitive ion channel family protein [Pseudomonadota bacterium]HNO68218.1 mechanosensitive ion channel family protein [Pseudomonadota bacterium]
MNPPSLDALEHAKRTLIDVGIHYGPRLVVAMLILIFGGFVAHRAGIISRRWFSKLELDQPLGQLLGRALTVLVFLLFLTLALQNLGVELLPLFASLGVAGVGVGLAAQGVLGNLVAGLTIIFTRPFRIGEWVQMIGVEGQVESIDLFSTTLSHPDRSLVVIPNRKIVGEVLHNYGKLRQLDLLIGVAYSTDIQKALMVVRDVLTQNDRVTKDIAPIVGVTLLGEKSVGIAIKPWVAVTDYVPAVGELNQALVEAFRTHRIEISFPQRDVRIVGSVVA